MVMVRISHADVGVRSRAESIEHNTSASRYIYCSSDTRLVYVGTVEMVHSITKQPIPYHLLLEKNFLLA